MKIPRAVHKAGHKIMQCAELAVKIKSKALVPQLLMCMATFSFVFAANHRTFGILNNLEPEKNAIVVRKKGPTVRQTAYNLFTNQS